MLVADASIVVVLEARKMPKSPLWITGQVPSLTCTTVLGRQRGWLGDLPERTDLRNGAPPGCSLQTFAEAGLVALQIARVAHSTSVAIWADLAGRAYVWKRVLHLVLERTN